MHLSELIGLRPLPCAGLLVALTGRCPLHCAHCSSASTTAVRDPDPEPLLRFIGSFGPADRPEVLVMTGGEPLLLPDLVVRVTAAAHRAGTRTALLTGAFFAREDRIPARVMDAIRVVDHFSVSIDAFHEREIPREHVYRTLHSVIDLGIAVSVHAVGSGPEDDYLADLVAQTRREFGDQVPMLVNTVRKVGRAAAWASAHPVDQNDQQVRPCSMAAWPVVAHDGEVIACCNQDAVDRRPVPQHLSLGRIAVDEWADVRERALSSPTLRMIRSIGPSALLARHGAPVGEGYCAGCRRLGEHPEVLEAVGRVASGPAGALLDQHVARTQFEAGPEAFVRRHGCAPYADLVTLTLDPGVPGRPQAAVSP